MVRVPDGEFTMGSNEHYPEEAPAHRVSVDGFSIDATAVTNAGFAAFAEETGYTTVAERPLDPADFPARLQRTSSRARSSSRRPPAPSICGT